MKVRVRVVTTDGRVFEFDDLREIEALKKEVFFVEVSVPREALPWVRLGQAIERLTQK